MNSRILRVLVLLLALKCLAAEAYRAAVAPSGLSNYGEYDQAAKRLNKGEPLYIHEQGSELVNQYVSSPLIPELLRPLARFPVGTGLHLWVGFNTVLLVLAVVLYSLGTGLRPLDAVAPALLLLFTAFRFWPTVLELAMGNVDIILLAAVCGMFICDRRGKWVWLALLAALAALTKTWMIGALFYLAARRKWRAATAGVVFFAAGLAILFCVAGWKEFPQWIEITRRYSSQPMIVSHSVAGIARMYFSPNPVMTPWVNSPALHALALAAGYGILLGGLFYLWWNGPRMNQRQARLCLGLTPLALILGSSVSHQYYFILALPLLWTLILGSAETPGGLGVSLAAFALYVAFSIPSPGDPLPEAFKHGVKSAEVAISFVSGMLLWGLGLFAVMRDFSFAQRPAADPLAPGK